jgi:hypothetical protein
VKLFAVPEKREAVAAAAGVSRKKNGTSQRK